MAIQSKTAAGTATVATRDDGQGHIQGAAWQPFGRLPVGATFHSVASTVGTLVVPATAQMALLALYPGAAMTWTTAATANGTLGIPLMAQGSYPEALEIVGSTMLAKFNYALLAGETTAGKFFIEYYRFVL